MSGVPFPSTADSPPTHSPANGRPSDQTRRRKRLPDWVTQTHRYVGIGATLLLLLLAGSGFLLNHPGLLGAPPERTLSLAVDPLDAAHLFKGTPTGLYTSYDGGQSWEEVPMLFAPERPVDIAFVPGAPDRIYVALEDLGLIRSLDGGIVWEKVPLGFVPLVEGVRLQKLGISSDERLFLWTSGGLLVGARGGQTWQPAGPRNPPGRDFYTLVHQIHTGYFFSDWFVYFYDAAAWGLILLSATGILIWVKRNGKTRRARL